jgi:hypothetical protein
MSNEYLAQQDAVIVGIASKTTVYGYAGSVYGLLADSSFAIMAGTIVTIAGFCVAFYFNRRKNIREKLAFEADEVRKNELHGWAKAEHEAKMANLKRDYVCEHHK